jgi:lambda family phage minor tail protein L
MSTNSLIQDLQKQSSGSSLVELFELEKYDGSFAYITPGEDSDGSSLQLYDYADNSTLRTYAPYPVTADGFDIKITGAIARPVCTFSNVGSNFTTLIGTSDIDSLLGKKFIRRLTLKKYLANEPGDTGSGVQSIEFVRQVWTIAKVTDRDSSSLIFELASPFDLQGVKIPARQIVANACPWEYAGASPDLTTSQKCGGCTWHRKGDFNIYQTTPITLKVYATIDDEYIFSSSLSYTNYTTASGSTSFSVDSYIKTTGESAKRISNTGIVSAVTDIVRYWIVNTTDTKDNLGSPTDSNAKFDAVRVYETYNASTTYKAYTDDRLNEMVQYDGFIWVVKKESTGNTPGFNEYWKRGDECGKRLSSCGKRFGFNAVDKTSTTSRAKASVNSYPQLPFGGFPGSKNFE